MIDSQRLHAASAASIEGEGQARQPVLATIPQGYDAQINVRFVRARDIDAILIRPGCVPRQGIPSAVVEWTSLSPVLVEKLRAVDQHVIGWLAKDAANAKRFMDEPVAALLEAGVELDRSEQKALLRSHGAVREAAAVPPGVVLERVEATAHKTARVSDHGGAKKVPLSRAERCGP